MAPAVIAVLVIAAAIVAVVFAVRLESAQSARRRDAWRRFAADHGLSFLEPSGPWYRRQCSAVEGAFEGVPIRLDTYVVSTGKSHTKFTRVRGELGRDVPKVSMARRTGWTAVGEALGRKSIPTGDSAFDRAMVTRSRERESALALLGERVRERVLQAPRRFSIACRGREAKVWWRGAELDRAVLESACGIVSALCREPSRSR